MNVGTGRHRQPDARSSAVLCCEMRCVLGGGAKAMYVCVCMSPQSIGRLGVVVGMMVEEVEEERGGISRLGSIELRWCRAWWRRVVVRSRVSLVGTLGKLIR